MTQTGKIFHAFTQGLKSHLPGCDHYYNPYDQRVYWLAWWYGLQAARYENIAFEFRQDMLNLCKQEQGVAYALIMAGEASNLTLIPSKVHQC